MKQFLQLIEYAAFRSVVGLIRAMPIDMASAVVGKLWRAIAPFNRRHKRALANLALAFPDKSQSERERIARDMWENLGRVMAESFQLDRLIADRERIIDDMDPAIRPLAGKSALMISMHSGNWEICVWPMTMAGFAPAAVYQKVKNPYVDAYIHKLRAPLYPGGLFTKSHDTGRKLVTWVRQGGSLALLADQRDNKGIKIPFFGVDAPTTPLPAMLAVRLETPLMIGRVIRLNGCRFKIESRILDIVRTGDSKADTEENTRRIHATFENWIREHPEQWMWGHRRWKSR